MFSSNGKAAVFVTMWAATIAAAQATDVGVANFTFNAAHRDVPVQALVWYPATLGGIPESVGDNAVFRGTMAKRGAKPEVGKHALIIFSHGAGGNAANLGWLSARLAEEGYIVVAPNHPGSTSGDSIPETNIKGWERPQDMSALLDALAASPGWASRIAAQEIVSMGFSIGGYTALALGGARVHAEALARYCDTVPTAMDCVWYDHGNDFINGHVDLHAVDAATFDASYADDRVAKVVAIDPGFAQAFDAASLAAMKRPTLILNLGNSETVPAGVEGKHLATDIPGSTYNTVDGANHFTFLGLCKTFGWIPLMFEGDDPVCTEVSDRRRADMHDEIAAKIIVFLKG
jgi:predicted dienelactone hydrolase